MLHPTRPPNEMMRAIFTCFLVGCGGLLAPSGDDQDGGRRDGALADGEADDACSGACLSKTPNGWDPVGYGPYGSCPSGWRVRLIIENPTAPPPTCWCSCGLKDQKCTTSSVLLEASTDPNCANAQTASLPHQGCAQTSFDYAPNGPIYVRGTGASSLPSGGSCSGTPNLVLPPAHADLRVMCVWPKATGTCRDSSRECRAPRDPMVRDCVARDGENNECPTGFPERHFVGDEIADARSCTSCECMLGPLGQCVTYVTTTASNNCSGPSVLLKADGTCGKYPNAQLHIGSETMYTVVEGAACVPKKGASEPIGTVGLWHPHTICCR